jgi:hypothetical protein
MRMGAKIGFLDLDYLRIGTFVSEEDMKNVPGMIVIKYRPPGLKGLFMVKEITNVPKGCLLTVTKEELGGLSTFDVWKVLVRGEFGTSHFLDRILSAKYAELVEMYNNLKKQLEIRKGVEVSRAIQYSMDALSQLERLKKVSEAVSDIIKAKPKRREIFRVGGEE